MVLLYNKYIYTYKNFQIQAFYIIFAIFSGTENGQIVGLSFSIPEAILNLSKF